MNEKKALFVSFLFLSFFFHIFFHSIFVVLTRNSSIVNKTRTKKNKCKKNWLRLNRVLTLNKKAFSYEKYENLRDYFFFRSTLPPLICICSTTFFPETYHCHKYIYKVNNDRFCAYNR